MTIFMFLLLVLVLWVSFLAANKPEEVKLEKTSGITDLTGKDFEDKVYLHGGYWESYPEELLTPEEFENRSKETSPSVLDSNDYERIEYSTHRTELKLKPDEIYAIHMKSSDYSMKIFINGKMIDTVGHPGTTSDTNTPRTAERTYYFQPEDEITTIVVQATNFVHKEGGSPPNFHIGKGQEIGSFSDYNHIITSLISGCLITAFLFYLSLYILNRRNLVSLIFSISCLVLVLKTNKLIPFFWPDYNWFFAIRVEYIVHFMCFATLTLFLNLLFPGMLNKYAVRIYLGVCGLFTLSTLILSTRVFTSLLIYFQLISVVVALYIFVKLALSLRGKNVENILAFVGIAVIGVFGANDMLSNVGINFLGNVGGQVFTVPIAMVFFVFCYSLVVSIQYDKTLRAAEQARIRIKEVEVEYEQMLAKSKDRSPKVSISQLNLSPREQDVAWLLIDGKSRKEIAYMLGISPGTVNTYCSRIYSKAGSSSFAEFIKVIGM